MIDSLSFIDKQFTLWLNSFHSNFFDAFFYLFTNSLTWIPLYAVLLWFVFQKQGVRGIVTVFFVAMIVLVADQLSSSLCKPLIARLRPSHDPMLQYMVHVVNDYRGGMYGFVSSHAANTFAVATFFSLIVRRSLLRHSLFAWATLNCYSRIYCGVHYFGDVLCGAILGMIIAAIFYQIYLRASLHFFVISHHNKRTLKSGLAQMFGANAPNLTATFFWFTVVLLFVAAKLMLKYHGAAC